MDATQFLEEVKIMLDGHFDKTHLKGKTKFEDCSIQEGFYDTIKIKYNNKNIQLYNRESTNLSDYKHTLSQKVTLDKEAFEKQVFPHLEEIYQESFYKKNRDLYRYHCRFFFHAKLENLQSVTHAVTLVDEEIKEALKVHFEDFRSRLVENYDKTLKDKKHSIIFANHLMDRQLNGYSLTTIQEFVKQSVENDKDKFRSSKKWEEYARDILHSLRKLTDEIFVKRYFDTINYNTKIKKDLYIDEVDSEALELYIYYLYLRIKLKDYPSLALEKMEILAKDFQSSTAIQYIKVGTGTFSTEDTIRKTDLITAKANDVTATISIKLKEESEESYGEALDYIIHLINIGFPRAHKIKLSGASKNFFPIKIPKSSSHKFYANVTLFPALHPKLEEYARIAMKEFEWYTDNSEEKALMPGSYAVFGLGLYSKEYFPLVLDYYKLLDDEHQSTHKYFVDGLVEQYGLSKDSVEVIVKGAISSQFDHKHKGLAKLLKDEKAKTIFNEFCTSLDEHDVDYVHYLVGWKK